MEGNQRLPIDIEYGVVLPDTYINCKTYSDKLQDRLQWAYQAAEKCIDKETTWYKKYYNKNYECAVLVKGDLVLVRIHVHGGEHKITDKWEQAPWEVTHIKNNSPLITVKNTCTGEVCKLHRNMLYPLRMVDNTDDNVRTPVLAKANVIIEDYFVCDCRNCRDTI